MWLSNDVGLSGGPAERPAGAPRSTPTYPRLRSLSSGHVRSNPLLGSWGFGTRRRKRPYTR